MPEIKNIVIVGAGNVGTHLALSLHRCGCNIKQVVGHREEAVKELSKKVSAENTLVYEDTKKGQDLYLLALPDRVIGEIAPLLGLEDELIAHTSGSVPMSILSPFSQNIAVFYPLQTFTSSRDVEFSNIPFLIEANRIDNENALLQLAEKLSERVLVTDSDKRQTIHMAAVFASNFSNHMYNLARHLAEAKDIDFSLLEPLIKETTAKALEMGPMKAQTGPALRADQEIIEKHLAMLSDQPALQMLYKLISQDIIDRNK